MNKTPINKLIKNMMLCLSAGGLLAACGGESGEAATGSTPRLLAWTEACNTLWNSSTAYIGGTKLSYNSISYV